MKALRFRLQICLLLLVATLAAGCAGFMRFEDLSLGDAVYFSIVTVATVGYGDIHPVTAGGKVLSTILIVMGVGTFLGVVANATDMVLTRREEAARLEKLNMVIGAFFSEIGTQLLSRFAAADKEREHLEHICAITATWTRKDFETLAHTFASSRRALNEGEVDLADLRRDLVARRGFLVRLLENPALLEHESFTDVLWAVFHLTEELCFRADMQKLPPSDLKHLRGDMQRAYQRLGGQWLAYMGHLKDSYPYLFSLAVRTNPFRRDMSVIVTETT